MNPLSSGSPNPNPNPTLIFVPAPIILVFSLYAVRCGLVFQEFLIFLPSPPTLSRASGLFLVQAAANIAQSAHRQTTEGVATAVF